MWYEIGIKILKILICFGIVFESFIIEFLIHLLTNNLIFIVWVYRLCILFYPSVCFHRYWMSWLLQLCNKFWDQVVLILQLHSIFQSCFGYFDYSSAFFFFISLKMLESTCQFFKKSVLRFWLDCIDRINLGRIVILELSLLWIQCCLSTYLELHLFSAIFLKG